MKITGQMVAPDDRIIEVHNDRRAVGWACGRHRATAYRYSNGVWGWTAWDVLAVGVGGSGFRERGFVISREIAARRAIGALAKACGVAPIVPEGDGGPGS